MLLESYAGVWAVRAALTARRGELSPFQIPILLCYNDVGHQPLRDIGKPVISRLETLESLWLAEGLTRACIAMVPACINMPDVTSLLHCSGFTKVSHYRSRP